MKLGELEKIIKQIKKYDLASYIDDIHRWLESLTEVGIHNFKSLNMELSNDLFKKVLVNEKLLNSPHYLEDVELINNAESDDIMQSLIMTATNDDSLNNSLHYTDMRMIYDCGSDYMADVLAGVACSSVSLESDYHSRDMDLINECDDSDKDKLIALENVACSEISINSGCHFQDMRHIYYADSSTKVNCLEKVATNKDSLESEYHALDMKLISEAEDLKIFALANVACCKDDLKYLIHIDEMQLISNAESDLKATYMSEIICDNMVNMYLDCRDELEYLDILNFVNNAVDDDHASYIKEVVVNEDSLHGFYTADNIIFVGFAPNSEVAEVVTNIITSGSINDDNYVSNMIDAINSAENDCLMTKEENLDYMLKLANWYCNNDKEKDIDSKILSIGKRK